MQNLTSRVIKLPNETVVAKKVKFQKMKYMIIAIFYFKQK